MKFQIYYCTNSSGSFKFVFAGCEDAAKDLLLKTEFFRYTSDGTVSHRCSVTETSGEYRLSDLRDQINSGLIKPPEGGWPDALVVGEWCWYSMDYTKPITLRSPDTGNLQFYTIPPYNEFQKIVSALESAKEEIRVQARKITDTDNFRASLKSFLEV